MNNKIKFEDAVFYDSEYNCYTYENIYFKSGYFYTKDKNKRIINVKIENGK